MSNTLRISLVVTTSLVIASVVGYLFLDSSGTMLDLGGFIFFLLWILVVLATCVSCLITVGIWIARKNRKANHDDSLHL